MQNKVTHIINRGVAQLVARDIWDVDAAGSNPVTPTMQGALIGFQCPLKALCFFIPKQMLYFKMNLMINLLENFQKCL